MPEVVLLKRNVNVSSTFEPPVSDHRKYRARWSLTGRGRLFGILENWSLRRSGRKRRFDCIISGKYKNNIYHDSRTTPSWKVWGGYWVFSLSRVVCTLVSLVHKWRIAIAPKWNSLLQRESVPRLLKVRFVIIEMKVIDFFWLLGGMTKQLVNVGYWTMMISQSLKNTENN